MMIIGRGKLQCLKKSFANAVLSATNPTWTTLGFNLDIHGEKLVTKRSSYGTASIVQCNAIL